MVHGCGVRLDEEPAADVRGVHQRRPGATNMLTGAALATINRLPVLLLLADTFARRSASPLLQELELPDSGDITVNDASVRCRDTSTGSGGRSSARRADVGDAGPDQPRRNRRGDIVLSAGRAGGGYDWPGSLFEKRVWHVARPLPRRQCWRRPRP